MAKYRLIVLLQRVMQLKPAWPQVFSEQRVLKGWHMRFRQELSLTYGKPKVATNVLCTLRVVGASCTSCDVITQYRPSTECRCGFDASLWVIKHATHLEDRRTQVLIDLNKSLLVGPL